MHLDYHDDDHHRHHHHHRHHNHHHHQVYDARKQCGLTGCQADALAFDRKLPFILHHVFDTLHDQDEDDDDDDGDDDGGDDDDEDDHDGDDRKLPFILPHMFDILHDYHDDDEDEQGKKLLLKLHHMFDTLYDYHEYVTITGKPTLSKYQQCSVFDTQAVQHRYQHNPSTTESSIRSDTKI